jgi:adenosylcobinamide-phosphate synthase
VGFLVAPLALLIERFVGYPPQLFVRIGHPVTWMGALITWLELRLNTGDHRRWKGVLLLVLLLGTGLAFSLLIIAITRRIPFGFVIEALLATSLIAQKELGRAVSAVADALAVALDSGRAAVAEIVGRDPHALDEPAVSRAAIESLAESTSDGIVAPLFWLLLLGLPGIVLYKAANTADSMVGHKSERYVEFGWASARFDDILNFIPARLSALLMAGGGYFVRGADPERAWATALRDGKKHDSPNAGWPEAALAGALGYALGGPRSYEGALHDLPQFGDGRADLGPADIHKSLQLYRRALDLLLGVSVVLALIAWRFA